MRLSPLLVRGAFLLVLPAGGLGVLVYAALAVLLPGPAAGAVGAHAATDLPRRFGEAAGMALLLAALLLVLRDLGLLAPLALFAPLGLLALGVALVWRRSTAPGDARSGAQQVLWVGAGVALVGGGVALLANATGALGGGALALIAAAVVAGAFGLVIGPRLRQARTAAETERRERIRTQERERVAERLHDSVLQTLALIQRTDDGVDARALARRQERELRAWLYGGEGPERSGDERFARGRSPLSFAPALRHAADEVEAAYGIVVGLVQPSDAPLDDGLEALVAAAREAMVNAAKHAGVQRVDVLGRVTAREASVFVRDRGAGFDRARVPADRHGLRDSIEGRIARVGGHATIVSAPGAGTEVELVLPRGPGPAGDDRP